MAGAVAANSQAALLAQIARQAPNVAIEQALLVGGTGESNLNPQSHGSWYNGSPTGGAFGFTSTSYPYADRAGTSSAAQQVADILPQYISAYRGTAGIGAPPSNLSGAALAEYIAISAERPLNDTAELSQIAGSNAPAEYGANSSYYAGNYPAIASFTKANPPQSQSAGGGGIGYDLSQFAQGGLAAITQPGAGIGQVYDWLTGTPNSSTSTSGSGSGSGLLAKVGGFLLGAGLLLIGVVILFKGNAPSGGNAPSVEGDAEEAAAA